MAHALGIAVWGIVLDQHQKVLLCHRTDQDLWNLPGGGLEAGETPWEGCIREVKEETGFDVVIEKVTGLYFKPETDEMGMAFRCQITGGAMRLNDEADQIKYFAFKDFPENTNKRQVERIKDALREPQTVHLKIQTKTN
ncbi:MAG: NUDIX domain-containing protein [Candidatus Uhrbacteria bacterium]|nr:NUDIX domain-containing protein [Candidatus Uhrbacteria bacterium]